MKNLFAAVLQFLFFLIIFGVFSFFPPFHLEHVVGTNGEGTRVFIWDGLLIATVLFVLALAVQAARKRIARAGLWTTAAYVVAILVGIAFKLGFKTNPGF
jgi:hypothetical protein